MKRHRHLSSSDSSDNESPSTSFSFCSKYRTKSKTPANEQKKPAEVFRKDLISAMKLPDSHHVNPDEYYLFADSWKQEWEKGVQVPASPDTIPQPSLRVVAEKVKQVLYTRPRKYIRCSNQESSEPGYINILELAESMCRYDLDDMDIFWLQEVNEELAEMGCGQLDENTMEKMVEVLERQCHENMNHAIETEEGLGIEYDEDVICDVCRSPDSEDGNDMVFCDKCNICVHQVSIACPERMEPITKVSHIPPSRWALVCSLCKLKTGACIQCSVKSCITAFHVTCAFEHSLEMKTILDDGDEVKFKSYCLKHSKTKQSLVPEAENNPKNTIEQKQTESEKTSLRAQKLRELEEEFYSLVRIDDVAAELGLPKLTVDLIYNYWKLKRKSNFNKPLFPPKEDEENGLVQPKEDSIHTRMRMFMHLRQDLERVRNLCYMVSRREKLKLSHSKAHEQVFNLQVQLINQEIAAGHSLTTALENTLFYPPPRITLKLKMPKSALGDCKNNLKPGNKLLSSDSNANFHSKKGAPLSKDTFASNVKSCSKFHHENRSNGVLGGIGKSRNGTKDSEPANSAGLHHRQLSGKPLALQAALHGQSSIGNGKIQQSSKQAKSNGVIRRVGDIAQRDSSSQTTYEQQQPVLSAHLASQSSFKKSNMEHFSRSFKEATKSLVRTTEDLRCCEKPLRRFSMRERSWGRPTLEYQVGSAPYQDNDGYCPDVELSDSEAESDENKGQMRLRKSSSERASPSRDLNRDCHSRNKRNMVSHRSVQR
ncbi:protein Jade-3 isoform X2 [Anolis sagrei]|uniref:protein Jade-3 isoform X2 n=1 Tax=Anolis sagrei TaxID=38937 RepID=UPI00352245DD